MKPGRERRNWVTYLLWKPVSITLTLKSGEKRKSNLEIISIRVNSKPGSTESLGLLQTRRRHDAGSGGEVLSPAQRRQLEVVLLGESVGSCSKLPSSEIGLLLKLLPVTIQDFPTVFEIWVTEERLPSSEWNPRGEGHCR